MTGAVAERRSLLGRVGAWGRSRAWDVAAILASWCAALLVVGDAESTGRLRGDAPFWHLLAGLLFSLALWWRRSHPVAVALTLAVVPLAFESVGLAGQIALFTVIARRRGRVVVLIAVVNLLCGVGYSLHTPDPAVPRVVNLLLTGALLTTTIALGLLARSRRELIESLRERAARAEEAAGLRADRLRALERERIAREMHDSLAHRISMVSLHAGALQIRPDLTAEEVAKAAGTIRDSAHRALEDLREILGVLRAGEGDDLRPQPDLGNLGDLLEDARKAGVRVEAANRLDGTSVGTSLGRTVYRLVQEGLTNAGKHAPGVPVHLLLEQTAGGDLHVLVSNAFPGIARTTVPGAGAGLVGLAERVELVRGRLRHGVRGYPGAGLTFDLEAWLPWRDENQATT